VTAQDKLQEVARRAVVAAKADEGLVVAPEEMSLLRRLKEGDWDAAVEAVGLPPELRGYTVAVKVEPIPEDPNEPKSTALILGHKEQS
jgi:hypothetical protein